METGLKRKYGLPTAICMVVGVVIGSGVFFKAEAVLAKTGGNMPLGILAWLIVGAIMVVCAYVFATMATRYEKVNGLVDYAEATVGNRYAYNIGWFMAVLYIPSLVGILAWVSARYTCVLLGWDIAGGSCMVIAGMYLCLDFALNVLSPRLAGKFQVSATVIKMIPLALMAVVGTVMSFTNGRMAENIASMTTAELSADTGLMAALVAVAFAYEGWILATTINAELKDAKKNLPRALVLGSIIVVLTYVLYYIGINGVISAKELMASGEKAVKVAFSQMLGDIAGSLIFVLVVVSCLGTLNGLTLACTRGMYSLAVRNEGPSPKRFSALDPTSNMSPNSGMLGLALSAFWLFYFYGANLGGGWFGSFNFDNGELPIITLYAMYVPIFICFMWKSTDLNPFKRFVMPGLALIGCVFMVYAAFAAYGVGIVCRYLIVFVVVQVIGNLLYRHEKKAAERAEG